MKRKTINTGYPNTRFYSQPSPDNDSPRYLSLTKGDDPNELPNNGNPILTN